MACKWASVRLGDVCTKIGSGATPLGGSGVYLTDGEIALIRSQNVYNDGFRREGLAFITQEHAQELEQVEIVSGDVLLNITGDSVARCCQVDESVVPARVNQHVAIVRPDPQKLDARFLRYLLVSPQMQDQMLSWAASGGTRNALTKGMIESFEIRAPRDVGEQRAIAHILGALDDKIELNRRMNETLEAMARAIFKSWFVDFDPVRAKAEGRQPFGMDAETAALFPSRLVGSELGEIPEGWDVAELPQEIDFLEGPGLRHWQYRDAGMKFLNIRCIVDGDLDIAKANSISMEEFEKTYSHFALREDDIVISTSGTLGRLAIVRSDRLPVMLNTSIIRMRGREPVGLAYVWGYLQSRYFLEEMFALAAGSVQLNFGPIHLRKIKVLRPPNDILRDFEDRAQPLIRQALHNRRESDTLAATRDTLLPKLISGEIRVGESRKSLSKKLQSV